MNISPKFDDLSYSVRRYYVDEFYVRNTALFPPGSRILDIGGKRINKRGQFNIEKYGFQVKYANLDEKVKPDYLCEAEHIPAPNGTFDGVVCAELIEHVPNPKAVLGEACRVLKPGGIMLLCAPFMYRMHADPYDYGRYTDFFYSAALAEAGFGEVRIEKQGLFFSVLADMLKIFAWELQKESKPRNRWGRKLFHKAVSRFSRKALEWDAGAYCRQQSVLNKFTTGFGIVARKSQ